MSPPKQLIRILIQTDNTNPMILEGLEVWLRLGLLSDAQIRQIGEQYLSEPLPPKIVTSAKTKVLEAEKITQNRVASKPPKPAFEFPAIITDLVQSLKAELSVRWLLFLGLFLVIVSSGVLAASQWERFPSTGQYLILFAYTFAFWGVSLWGNKQSSLPVTATALKLVTLVLIPLNFWAMDGLKLWLEPLGLITMAIATLALTTLTIILYRNQGQLQHRPLFNHLGLSYLNWGWQIPGFPVIAVYLGIIITGILTIANPPPNSSNQSQRIDPKIVVIYLLTLLFSRAIFGVNVEISQLGLALGIFSGFLYVSPSLILHRCSYGILFFGWLITIFTQPGQAFLISGIGIGIFTNNLLKYWKRQDLAAIFGLGLSMVVLVGRLIPPEFRQTAISVGVEVANSQNSPWALLSLTWFPYLIFIVALTDWIYHRPQRKLAQFGDQISLIFGVFLTSLSILNPALRSLNLLASTITLAVITHRRQPLKPPLVLATHILGLVTVCNLVYWQFPALTLELWAIILLGLMVGEFLLFTVNSPLENIIRKDALNLGIVLSELSYMLFLTNFYFVNKTLEITWLITPLALTVVATKTTDTQRIKASQFSFAACGLVQILTLPHPQIRLFSLGLTTLLMVVNTQLLKTLFASVFTIGLGLGFLLLSVQDLVTREGWLMLLSLTVTGLWIFRLMLCRYGSIQSTIIRLYKQALDGWAIALLGFELSVITLHSFGLYSAGFPGNFNLISTLIILIIALIFRGLNLGELQRTAEFGFSPWILYSLAWTVELLIVEILIFNDRSLVSLAVANITLGLMTQLLGDWWKRHYNIQKLPNPLQIIPIVYGILGVIFRFQIFANWTGLTSLGFALILIGIGRRNRQTKALVYLGLLGVSVSTYEILFYQIQSQSLAEQWIAFATLGTSLMYIYRIFSSGLSVYLRLPETEIKPIAHLHWLISSVCLLLASFNQSQSQPLLAIGTSVLLVRYAIFQGRHNPNLKASEIWIYLGLTEATALIIYLQNLYNLNGFFIPWSGSIVSIISWFFYILPWNSWGWSVKPWKTVAIILPIITVMSSRFLLQPEQQLTWYFSATFAILFYIALSHLTHNIRFNYLSLILINFIFYDWLFSTFYQWDAFIFTLPLASSLLYFSQFEPILNLEQNRPWRHGFRLGATGLLCATSLLAHSATGILPGILSLIIIFAGLGLKIRAFLYMGTATFLINIVNQLIILNSIYSFMKWVISFILGLILIWIAATFETRREQLITLWNNWMAELETWD
ncbi:conserved membrane hypothetical protein [Planktothrix serta PCC 8927]|uniref:DUF2157 domain-containing protein n=1 Tax=Planktothrix serta PCC 8927 TaxID=671068 RepID=A0A7Z9C0A9_9CYAN|nr:hypothetical protein [Planktothrix serta]VXD22741.1 conserved membrane hypothetical protein [Planktothrix serta PCC 8927]